MASKILVIDFETRSLVDLKKTGHAYYAAHPATDVICAAWVLGDEPNIGLWVRGDPVPVPIIEACADPSILFGAHNAAFEIAIWKNILTPRYGWPQCPPVERWRCSMAQALALALPPRLDNLAKALGLKHQKADDAIMHLMSKPRRPRGDEDPNGGPYWFDDPERLAQLYEYWRQDVRCERELFQWLPPLHPDEQKLWCLDQTINYSRGFYTDGVLIEKALTIVAAAKQAIKDEIQQLTGGALCSANQTEKLLIWLEAHDCKVDDLQKGTLARALTRKGLAPEVRRVIELRQEAAHASANKFEALKNWRCVDGRIRGAFKFHGAATGRWSGSGPQPQNFRRDPENLKAKFEAVMSGDIAIVRQLGAPLEIVGDVARATICAPPGRKLIHGDYSAIESRTLAWITGEASKLALWAKFDQTKSPDDDPYVVIGRSLGHPEETARQFGKIADLAFGFGGGVGAYKNFAPPDDTATEAQIEAHKFAWRAQHPQTVQFWRDIERAAIAAIRRSPNPIDCGRFVLRCERLHDVPFLFITLPSGRDLAYPFVEIITNGKGFPAVSFMDNQLGKWAPVRYGQGVWGGTFTENLTQAIARDHLAAALLRLEAAGYPVVLHVHDSICVEVPDGSRDV
jgi:DNA polymerase